ncbi:MAG: hypothetical protein HUJ69_05765 [Lachnospiraceae bacterium]|nr:hypothetical protein [Lachnospiraceae bacterium]
MKKVCVWILCAAVCLSLMGCGNKETEPEANTTGTKLLAEFKKGVKAGQDLAAVAEAMAEESVSGYSCGTAEVTEGWLSGFSGEVTGFTKGYMIMPWIGTVPLVCYVFETEDPEALLQTLNDLADPRWNICTEAEETVGEVVDGYVFFAMCPGEDF